MRPAPIRLLMALLASSAASVVHAGAVEVHYDASRLHSDAGNTTVERERSLGALAEHLRMLGARQLPADRRLEIELIDLDRAGTVRVTRRPLGEVRVVDGRADGPRIELRYTLSDAAGTQSSGTESLHDVNLPRLGELKDANVGDPLRQEKTLLDHWFEARFGTLH